jgi:hypothetical protein
LAQPHEYLRICPEHGTEIVFRPNEEPEGLSEIPKALSNLSEVPWCYTHDHVLPVWLVADESGRVLAAARISLTREQVRGHERWYVPFFDVDALIQEALWKDETRRLATPVSQGSPLSTGYSQIKAIAAWSYKRRQRAEAVA